MRSTIVPVLLAALIAGGCDRQSPPPPQGNAAESNVAVSDEVPPPSPDEATGSAPRAAVGSFDKTHAGTAAPDFPFTDPAGKTVTLASFKGTPVLVNLWATWCAPCIKEMPTLDALAKAQPGVKVLAISQDMEAAKMTAFWQKGGYTAIQPYHDAKLAFSTGMAATLPTTILYDAAGKEVWRVTGPREWADAETIAAIKAAL